MTDNTQTEALLPSRETLMAQAQVFASAWAIAGSSFDTGDGMEVAEQEKAILADMTRRLHARIAELEAQLESIGAGGVSGPLIGQPQAVPDLTALTERGAKAWTAVDAQALRDGVASVAASAPAPSGHIKEPYTVAEIKAKIASNDYSAELLLQHAMLHLDRLAASAVSEPVEFELPPTPFKSFAPGVEIGYDLFGGADIRLGGEFVYVHINYDCRYTHNSARMVLAEQIAGILSGSLVTHPSPSEGMVGGWISVDKRLPEPNVEVLCAGQGWGKPFVTACYYDDGRREWYPINTYWTDSTGSAQYPTHWMPLPPPPTSSADSRKGE